MTRIADSSVSNTIIRNRPHLVPLPFPLSGLLEGAVVTGTYMELVRTAVAPLQQENTYVRMPIPTYV